MNLIYMRNMTPRTRKFLKDKLQDSGETSIYDMEEGDCCLPPAPAAARDYLLTFLNDASPEMLDFFYRSTPPAPLNAN